MNLRYSLYLCLFGLICINHTQAQTNIPQIKMDSTAVKKMVGVSCECFKVLRDIPIPNMDFTLEPQRDTQKRDSMEQAGKVLFDKIAGCLSEKLKSNKEKFGFGEVADSLFDISSFMKGPPLLLRTVSPNVILYGMRDCPYIFNFFTRAMDLMQELQFKRMARQDSMERARLADTLNVPNVPIFEPSAKDEEYNERPNFKRIKATLKRIENKKLPYLVVERKNAEDKKYEEKFLIIYRPDDEQDIIKNFKQHKGKEVRLEARKQEIFNPQNNQYEQIWRITEISFVE